MRTNWRCVLFRINSWLLVFCILAAATTACAFGSESVEESAGVEPQIVARAGEYEISAEELEAVVGGDDQHLAASPKRRAREDGHALGRGPLDLGLHVESHRQRRPAAVWGA